MEQVQPIYVDENGQPIAPPVEQPPMLYVDPGPPTPRPPPDLHGMIGVHVDFNVFQASPYRTASRAWGYDAFGSSVGVAIDGGYHLHRAILLGARLGVASADGGASAFDRERLSLTTFDFDGIARVGYPLRLGRGDWIFFPGFQLELGGLYALTSLRSQHASAVVPRAAAVGVFAFSSKHIGVGLRLGYQYAWWNNAAGSGADLSLSGLVVGLGIEVRL